MNIDYSIIYFIFYLILYTKKALLYHENDIQINCLKLTLQLSFYYRKSINQNTHRPITMVKIVFFVRQAIIIAIIPATNRGFCGEIHIISSFIIIAGKISADKTAAGTKGIAL